MSATDASNDAAPAVCHALEEHIRHGGSLPWPSIYRPLEDVELAERLRDQTADATWGVVDV